MPNLLCLMVHLAQPTAEICAQFREVQGERERERERGWESSFLFHISLMNDSLFGPPLRYHWDLIDLDWPSNIGAGQEKRKNRWKIFSSEQKQNLNTNKNSVYDLLHFHLGYEKPLKQRIYMVDVISASYASTTSGVLESGLNGSSSMIRS